MRAWIRSLLLFFYPSVCGQCRAVVDDGEEFCPSCWLHLVRAAPDAHTGIREADAIDELAFGFVYNDFVQHVIHAVKYEQFLSGVAALANHCPRPDFVGPEAILVPVPLHPARLRERGYNQAALFAEALAERWSVRSETDMLCRKANNESQTVMDSPEERKKNVEGIFAVRNKSMVGRDIVLIDDVVTTGATVNECANALKRGGARRVFVFGIARPEFQ